jgi:hypothetical protein
MENKTKIYDWNLKKTKRAFEGNVITINMRKDVKNG